MTKVYYNQDADLSLLSDKKVAVIGYGSQGHAQAQNLHDSGVEVVVGLRKKSKSWQQAEEDGLNVAEISEAAREGDIVQLLAPDVVQAEIYHQQIKENMVEGNMLLFSHGFNIHYHQIVPPKTVDLALVAPKSPGHLLRRVYQEGGGVPALFAVKEDYTGQARELTLAYARGIGSTRAGVIETTFKEETETDLFGEQAVLCGGVTELIKAGFDTLIEAGYQPEIAYFECLHELKLIVDLIYEGGLAGMRYSISDTAEYGDYTRGKRVIDQKTRERMKDILSEVQDGEFAREWITENRVNRPVYKARQKQEAKLQIEQVGKKLRDMMQWIQ